MLKVKEKTKMKRTVYKNLLIDHKLTDMTVEDGKIASLSPTKESGVDCKGLDARAGLFEIHAHGCMGIDTMDGDLVPMANAMGQRGITSWLPTTMTLPREQSLAVTRELPETDGARIRGFHLEGPFINVNKKGAQNPLYVQKPDLSLLDACPHAKIITVAPEVEGARVFIADAKKRGVKVALGHTECDYTTAVRAMRAGADSLTHTFNAMPPFPHRDRGPIGAALTEDCYVQVISDGIHLHPAVVLALYKMFGPERMILISDTVSAAGLSDGEYSLGGLAVYCKNGKATLADGTLAGSATFLDDCVRRAISFGIPAEDAFRMASETPARYLGIQTGRLSVGYDADFILTDADLSVRAVFAGGKTVKPLI